jgi:hypothetical protein
MAMALGSQTQRYSLIAFAALCAAAQPVYVDAVEKRLGRDRPGRLLFEAESVTFMPARGEARRWTWPQVQRLELTAEGEVFLTLYRDVWWQAERDQRLHFSSSNLKQNTALAALLKARIGDRFIPRLALPQGGELWRAPAKLLRGWGGPEGEFVLNAEGWQFLSPEPGHSFSIDDRLTANISSFEPLLLSISVRGGRRQYELQLKEPLPPGVYDAWWQRLNRPRGLDLIPVGRLP